MEKEIINDIFILNFFKCNGLYVAKRFNAQYINKHNPDILTYMYNRFSDITENTPIKEIYYRIEHNIDIVPKCPICGKPIPFKSKYGTFCSRTCKYSEKGKLLWKNLIKNTMVEKYGVEHALLNKNIYLKMINSNQEKYGVDNVFQSADIKNKIINTNLERYGVERALKSDLVKTKIRDTYNERYYSGTDEANILKEIKFKKFEETMMKHYGVKHALLNKELLEKVKANNLEKYGVEYIFNRDDFKEKTIKTVIKKYGSLLKYHQYQYDLSTKSLQKNKNNGMTKPEKLTYDYLLTLFDKDNILFNVNVDDRYPYHVDFYIKSLDLFIEINAYWTHGKHPFDENNEEDKELLNIWKEKSEHSILFKNAVTVWTITDPEKIKYAKDNNLNYLPIWSDNIDIIKQKINEYINV